MKPSHQPLSSVGLVLVLWVAGLGAAAQFAKISVIFPSLQELYPEAGSELGLLVSMIGFLGIGLGLFAGLISARIGLRRLLLSALLLGALMSVYQATLPPFVMMLISRLIEGASHLAIVVAAPTMIAKVSSDRYRGLAMTLWSTFFGVAFALVAWLGIPLTSAYGVESLFLAHAVILLATAAVLARWLPPQPALQRQSPGMGMADIVREHIQSYRSPFVSAPAIGWLFYTLTFVSLLTILPDLVPPEDRSFVSGMMPLASIVVSLICGAFFLPRMTAINVIILGFALAMCTVLLLWVGVGRSWICITLFGILGLVQGASFAAISQLNIGADAQARANGTMAQMGNLGNTIGAPLLLSLLAAFGLNGLIWGVLICYCGGIGAHVRLRQRRRMSRVI